MARLTRLADWDARLTAVLEAAALRAFEYGAHDCAIHAADAILAVTGVDVAVAWRGRYDTMEAGLRVAKARGVVALATRLLPPIPLAMARRGDIAGAPVGARMGNRREMMLLVLDGAVLRGPAAAVVHRSEATRAWRVG